MLLDARKEHHRRWKPTPAGGRRATRTSAHPAYHVPMRSPRTQEARERARAEKIQRALDEALADSFPASDPVSIV